MLVQAKWASDLLDTVLESGGFPLVFGCLERETMLVVGPDLAATSAAARAAERTTATRGVAMLEVLATAPAASPVVTQVIAALLDARLVDECEIDAAAGVLAAAGLIPPLLLDQARAHADATIAGDRAPARSVRREAGLIQQPKHGGRDPDHAPRGTKVLSPTSQRPLWRVGACGQESRVPGPTAVAEA